MSVTAIIQPPAEPATAQHEPTWPGEVEFEPASSVTTALEHRAGGAVEGEWLAIALTEMAVAALS